MKKKEHILFLIVLFILMFFIGNRLMAHIRNKKAVKEALTPPPSPKSEKSDDFVDDLSNKWYYQAD